MRTAEEAVFEMYQSGDLNEAQILKLWFQTDSSGMVASDWTIGRGLQEKLLLEACYKSHEKLIGVLLEPNLLDYCSIDAVDEVMEVAQERGLLDIIRFYIEYSVCDLNELLYWVCKQPLDGAEGAGMMSIFDSLLKNDEVDAGFDSNLCIGAAAKYGNLVAVSALIGRREVDPSDYRNYALCMAAKYGHVKIVEVLLTDRRVVPADDDNRALRLACKLNRVEIVRLLLETQRVDPSCRKNACIQYAVDIAVETCNTSVLVALLSDSRVSLSNAQAISVLEAVDHDGMPDLLKVGDEMPWHPPLMPVSFGLKGGKSQTVEELYPTFLNRIPTASGVKANASCVKADASGWKAFVPGVSCTSGVCNCFLKKCKATHTYGMENGDRDSSGIAFIRRSREDALPCTSDLNATVSEVCEATDCSGLRPVVCNEHAPGRTTWSGSIWSNMR